MKPSTALKAKSNAYYQCQECGATEFIQAHHQIPDDDNSIVVLCAECHSKKHPNIPWPLFFNKNQQPYWGNKSASSLARQLRVHPRTIIRTARKLTIERGELTKSDENQIRNTIIKHPVNAETWSKFFSKFKTVVKHKSKAMTRVTVQITGLYSTQKAAAYLGVTKMTLWRWTRDGIITPVMLDHTYYHINELDRIKALRRN